MLLLLAAVFCLAGPLRIRECSVVVHDHDGVVLICLESMNYIRSGAKLIQTGSMAKVIFLALAHLCLARLSTGAWAAGVGERALNPGMSACLVG